MTEQQYNLEIEQCLKLLENGGIDDAHTRLECLYKIKPVRLNWYIAKARYIWKTTRTAKQPLEILKGKSRYFFLYPGVREMAALYMDLVNSYQDVKDAQRHKFLFMSICSDKTSEDENWLMELNQRFREQKSEFIQHPTSEKSAGCLLDYYFIFHNNILFFLLKHYMKSKNMVTPVGRSWFLEFTNNGFLAENLSEDSKAPFIIVEDENSDGLDEEIAVHILRQLQKKIYYIKSPIVLEAEQEIDMEGTVAASINTMEVMENVYTIHPAAITCKGELLGDNREYIINYLIKNDIKKQHAVVLASGFLMDNLCCQAVLKKNLERLHTTVLPSLEAQMVFGWAGDYLSYISQVHDMNARRFLTEPAKVSYSIIVPARNSAHTLRYTLMTCLNQRYKGKYEIVLSDNSTPGNTEVYQLYKELDDPRIKYYRTPREYSLSRSFEFAFLHAEGEFLLSLGSDDALLPWALEILDNLRKDYPDENVIQWERGFYAWPGFNGGQQHQFVIPRNYQKDELHPQYLSRQQYLSSIFSNSDRMYLLPNLYLNSGCRREYLNTILEKTGRLFDGICQDIYMGIVNAAINEEILNIRYPLVIAGMAGGSMGAKANRVYARKEDEVKFINDLRKTANIGGYCASPYERLMPEVTTDKSSLYNCILRMIARGIIAESDLEYIDFCKWFTDVYNQMYITDPLFDKKIHYFRYTASLHGEEFLAWFDENIYYKALTPRLINEEKLSKLQAKKSYTEGRDPAGGRTLDASKYNVHNVYDAAKLFEKLSGL